MVWINHGDGGTRTHPIHLHGHSFHVLKMGYPSFNATSAHKLSDNTDVSCGDTPKNYCNKPTWSDSTWKNGNIPGLKLKKAPQKDTLVVPTGGYTVIRFRSDNPGKWFLHCHIEMHSLQGMSLVLNEAKEKHSKPPVGFPVCNNFYNDEARDIQYVEKSKLKGKFIPSALFWCIFMIN